MAVQLVDGDWGKELTEAIRNDDSELRIICESRSEGDLPANDDADQLIVCGIGLDINCRRVVA